MDGQGVAWPTQAHLSLVRIEGNREEARVDRTGAATNLGRAGRVELDGRRGSEESIHHDALVEFPRS